jgi:hypothetical protein
MDRKRARELLSILEAFANGEQLQFRLIDDHAMEVGDWTDLPEDKRLCVTFPCDDYEYRIKPKAREFYLCGKDDKWHAAVKRGPGSVHAVPPGLGPHECELIKVREVIECD